MLLKLTTTLVRNQLQEWISFGQQTIQTQLIQQEKLLLSTADVDGSNSGVLNANRGKYRHVILPLVATDKDGVSDSTKQYYWGLSSSEDSQIMLGVWEEPHLMQPQANGNTEDVQTDAWTFRQRAGYGTAALSVEETLQVKEMLQHKY